MMASPVYDDDKSLVLDMTEPDVESMDEPYPGYAFLDDLVSESDISHTREKIHHNSFLSAYGSEVDEEEKEAARLQNELCSDNDDSDYNSSKIVELMSRMRQSRLMLRQQMCEDDRIPLLWPIGGGVSEQQSTHNCCERFEIWRIHAFLSPTSPNLLCFMVWQAHGYRDGSGGFFSMDSAAHPLTREPIRRSTSHLGMICGWIQEIRDTGAALGRKAVILITPDNDTVKQTHDFQVVANVILYLRNDQMVTLTASSTRTSVSRLEKHQESRIRPSFPPDQLSTETKPFLQKSTPAKDKKPLLKYLRCWKRYSTDGSASQTEASF